MDLRLNREMENQMKIAKMTPEEKEAYVKELRNKTPNSKETLFEGVNLNGENQTITEEGVKLYTSATTAQTNTTQETEDSLPSFKDEYETLLFTLYGKNWDKVDTNFDITQFEFKKD